MTLQKAIELQALVLGSISEGVLDGFNLKMVTKSWRDGTQDTQLRMFDTDMMGALSGWRTTRLLLALDAIGLTFYIDSEEETGNVYVRIMD